MHLFIVISHSRELSNPRDSTQWAKFTRALAPNDALVNKRQSVRKFTRYLDKMIVSIPRKVSVNSNLNFCRANGDFRRKLTRLIRAVNKRGLLMRMRNSVNVDIM